MFVFWVLDTFDCHRKDSVSKSVKQKKIESLLIPGGCAKYVKPCKVKVSEGYNEWLSTDGIKNLTGGGSLKSPWPCVIVKWILKV